MIIFFHFSLKPYVVTPHLNQFIKMVQMRGQNICFYAEFPSYMYLELWNLQTVVTHHSNSVRASIKISLLE